MHYDIFSVELNFEFSIVHLVDNIFILSAQNSYFLFTFAP